MHLEQFTITTNSTAETLALVAKLISKQLWLEVEHNGGRHGDADSFDVTVSQEIADDVMRWVEAIRTLLNA